MLKNNKFRGENNGPDPDVLTLFSDIPNVCKYVWAIMIQISENTFIPCMHGIDSWKKGLC